MASKLLMNRTEHARPLLRKIDLRGGRKEEAHRLSKVPIHEACCEISRPHRGRHSRVIEESKYEDAIRMAAPMKGPTSKEVQYLWYSLQVISVEDIGYGDPEAVGCALYGNLSTIRNALGADALLSAIIHRLCTTPAKSRACCEISQWCSYRSLGKFNTFPALGQAKLVELASRGPVPDWGEDPDQAVVNADEWIEDQYVATCILRGMVPRSVQSRRPTDREGLNLVQESVLQNESLDPLLRWAAASTTDRATESMHCGFYSAVNNIMPGTVVQDEPLTEEVIIKTVTSVAFDTHTGPGRIALKAFHTSLKKQGKAIAQIEDMRALWRISFLRRGQPSYQSAVLDTNIQDVAENARSRIHSWRGSQVWEEYMEIVRNEIPRLNQKRLWASNLG